MDTYELLKQAKAIGRKAAALRDIASTLSVCAYRDRLLKDLETLEAQALRLKAYAAGSSSLDSA